MIGFLDFQELELFQYRDDFIGQLVDEAIRCSPEKALWKLSTKLSDAIEEEHEELRRQYAAECFKSAGLISGVSVEAQGMWEWASESDSHPGYARFGSGKGRRGF